MIISAPLFVYFRMLGLSHSNKILNSKIDQKNKLKGKFVFLTTVFMES